jgi:hypothetical protein
MKLIALAAIVALAFAGCEKKQEVALTEEPSPPIETPIPTTPPPATPPPATPAPELAPEGVFYLVTSARVETTDGIRGLPPGTGVKLVREGIYLTPVGEVPLDPSQLTNDMQRARQARDADRAAQADVKARALADKAAADSAARIAATPLPLATQSAATAKLEELSRQSSLIYIELRRISDELDRLPNSDPKKSPAALRLYQRQDQLREQLRKISEQRALIR